MDVLPVVWGKQYKYSILYWDKNSNYILIQKEFSEENTFRHKQLDTFFF